MRNNLDREERIFEIIGKSPTWIVRFGIVLVLFIMLLLLLGSYFFKYPETVKATILLTTTPPPINIISNANGKMKAIYVEDNESVYSGQVLAIVNNPAEYADVMEINKWLESSEPILQIVKHNKLDRKALKLGEIQGSYEEFVRNYNAYYHFLNDKYSEDKLNGIKAQLEGYGDYLHKLNEQSNTLKKELVLSCRQRLRDSILFVKDAISEVDWEYSQNKNLNIQYQFKGSEVNISQTKTQIQNLNLSLIEGVHSFVDQEVVMERSLVESINILKAGIRVWEMKYIMKSPVKGIVTFTGIWSSNQDVVMNKKVFTIIPEIKSEILGKLSLASSDAGKVKVGQKVKIRLNAYPYMEYGILEGVVNSISLVTDNQHYILDVDLPNGLVTTYGEKLNFHYDMQGEADIVAKDMRLIQKLFDPLKSIMKN